MKLVAQTQCSNSASDIGMKMKWESSISIVFIYKIQCVETLQLIFDLKLTTVNSVLIY